MEDNDGGWWWRTAERFYSTLVCKQGRPLTVVVDLRWLECANPAPMLCTKTTTRSSCLLLPPQGMACGWSLTLWDLSLRDANFYLLHVDIPKVTVAAHPIEWTRKVGCWTLENHFKQVKLKLNCTYSISCFIFGLYSYCIFLHCFINLFLVMTSPWWHFRLSCTFCSCGTWVPSCIQHFAPLCMTWCTCLLPPLALSLAAFFAFSKWQPWWWPMFSTMVPQDGGGSWVWVWWCGGLGWADGGGFRRHALASAAWWGCSMGCSWANTSSILLWVPCWRVTNASLISLWALWMISTRWCSTNEVCSCSSSLLFFWSSSLLDALSYLTGHLAQGLVAGGLPPPLSVHKKLQW